MPLQKSSSRAAFANNVKREMAAGKPQKQAVAIAYTEKRKAGGDCATDMLEKAVAAGKKESEAQQQARRLLAGEHISGRDRQRAKR